jgi:hypothetical protein
MEKLINPAELLGKVNVNFTIVNAKHIDNENTACVIGVNLKNGEWVTWIYNESGYFWGHYFNNMFDAVNEFKDRK